MRETLKKLEKEGLIEVRHCDGTFIAQLSGEAMTPALVNLYGRHGIAFFDYLEYGRNEEGFAAKCAAERATHPYRDAIQSCLDWLVAAYKENNLEDSLKADIAFHTAIVKASYNVMLIHMMRSIHEMAEKKIFFSRNHLREIAGSPVALLQQHKAIAEAILLGDGEAAEQAARAHMNYVEEKIRWQMEFDNREAVAEKRQMKKPGR